MTLVCGFYVVSFVLDFDVWCIDCCVASGVAPLLVICDCLAEFVLLADLCLFRLFAV